MDLIKFHGLAALARPAISLQGVLVRMGCSDTHGESLTVFETDGSNAWHGIE